MAEGLELPVQTVWGLSRVLPLLSMFFSKIAGLSVNNCAFRRVKINLLSAKWLIYILIYGVVYYDTCVSFVLFTRYL